MDRSEADLVRLAVRILTSALALVGLGTVVGWVWTSPPSSPTAPDNLTVVASPDGSFKAALASWDGGGAIAPFCYDRVFVVPAAVPNDRLVDDKNLVFAGACATFEDHSNAPNLTWRGPNTLLIRFSTLETASFPATMRLRRLAADGKVEVEFEVGH